MELDKHVSLVSYGAITKDFKVMAGLTKRMNEIKNGKIEAHRLDCYPIGTVPDINRKFESIGHPQPQNMEIFMPSANYPSHVDEGGMSYFIPLEEGIFTIDDVDYMITPFVLYAFEDGKLHNTLLCAIMLK